MVWLLKDSDSSMRENALKAIAKLAVIGQFFSCLSTRTSNATQAGPHPITTNAVQPVVGLLQDDASEVRDAALETIAKLASIGQLSATRLHAHLMFL